jgi:hypothetical protein
VASPTRRARRAFSRAAIAVGPQTASVPEVPVLASSGSSSSSNRRYRKGRRHRATSSSAAGSTCSSRTPSYSSTRSSTPWRAHPRTPSYGEVVVKQWSRGLDEPLGSRDSSSPPADSTTPSGKSKYRSPYGASFPDWRGGRVEVAGGSEEPRTLAVTAARQYSCLRVWNEDSDYV